MTIFFKDTVLFLRNSRTGQESAEGSSLTNGFCSYSALLGVGKGEGEEGEGGCAQPLQQRHQNPKQSSDRGQLKLMGPEKDVSLLLNS